MLNRLTRKIYPDSTEADYVYDLVAKIQQVNDPTGTYAFAYDNMGRLIGTTTNYSFLSGKTFTNSYAYDAATNRTGFTDPESGSTTYAYDTLNRLQTLTPAAISGGRDRTNTDPFADSRIQTRSSDTWSRRETSAAFCSGPYAVDFCPNSSARIVTPRLQACTP